MIRAQLSTFAAAAVTATALTASAPAAASGSCPLPRFGPGASYHPVIDPTSFTASVDNRWFPLPVGQTWVYAGTDGSDRTVDVVTVTRRTRVIDGVQTRVVGDVVLTEGVLSERTSDYFAQDRCGNVWYFGEDTAELDEQGHVTSREGTWHAGVHGAEPGVIMQANPELGRRFRQEWLAGHAEDVYVAVDRNVTVTVPYGRFTNALRTIETSRLEPGVRDSKLYAPGVGPVAEMTLKGPAETLELVAVLR